MFQFQNDSIKGMANFMSWHIDTEFQFQNDSIKSGMSTTPHSTPTLFNSIMERLKGDFDFIWASPP